MPDQSHTFLYHKTEELSKLLLKSGLSPSIQTPSSTEVTKKNRTVNHFHNQHPKQK